MKRKIDGKLNWIAGVDEAGRGPLAGPVAVGVALVPYDFDWDLIPGVGDSKKVSEKNREAIFLRTQELAERGILQFSVTLVSESVIDTIGITHAVTQGIAESFATLRCLPEEVDVRLDGLLKAPKEFLIQETIIKGDQKEKVIGLASILAKVTRDAHMVRGARDYPQYSFEIHKGYGTLKHRNAIMTHGLTKIHRRSFTKKFKEYIRE